MTNAAAVRKGTDRIADLYDGFIFDLDGTVYLGEKLIPGADRAIRYLRENGKKWVFLSNKPLEPRENYARKLSRLGVATPPEQVVNSSLVMAKYLRENHPKARVYVVGEQPLVDELRRYGVNVVNEPSEEDYLVDLVVAAFDRTFDYAKLNNAYQCIKRGAELIATNPDRTCPVEGGEIPDCAAVIGAIEGASGKKCRLIVGKPSPVMVDTVLSILQLDKSRCLLVGDRLETDMVMGKSSGIDTALVLTGVTKQEDLERSDLQPTWVLASISDLCRPGKANQTPH